MTLKKIFFLAIILLISFPNIGQERMNKLINEKSLYLKQHSSNPVDWVPWGTEALTLAKNQKKLIIISVGYSSCHWCHVMEEETFSDDQAAQIMNKNFINKAPKNVVDECKSKLKEATAKSNSISKKLEMLN